MARNRKPYARYSLVRGHQTLWQGDPAKDGSKFRQVVITSDEFNSTLGIFQVYSLEGTGKGIKDGALAASDEEPKTLFDGDFQGLDAAGKKFKEIYDQAVVEGFKPVTLFDEMEFQAKLKGLI